MKFSIKVDGAWRTVQDVYVKHGGIWKTCGEVQVKDNGTWKTVMQDAGTVNITSSTTWTVPAYITSATFTLCGGGGGGGGSDGGSKNDWLFGDGGYGSYLYSVTIPVSGGQVYTFNIGAGGEGALAPGGHNYPSGYVGATSTIIAPNGSAVITAPGGAGGASRYAGYFIAGHPSANGGARGGDGSPRGYKNVPGSPGNPGFGSVTWGTL
jgi:hypothetical protein